MHWKHKDEFMMIAGDLRIYQTLTPNNSIFHRRIPADFGYVVQHIVAIQWLKFQIFAYIFTLFALSTRLIPNLRINADFSNWISTMV